MPLDLPIPVLALLVVFTLSGLMKLAGTSRSRSDFERWGYPPFFRITVGLVELAAVAMMFQEATRGRAALVLLVLMAAALGTHIKLKEWAAAPIPVILGALLVLVLFSS